MIVVPFYWANSIDNGVDCIVCTTEAEAITNLIDIMKEFNTGRSDETSHDRLLDTAASHVKKSEIDEALQVMDTWLEEHNSGVDTFMYIIKEIG